MRAARRRSLSILVVVGLTLIWAALAFAAGTSPARAGSDTVAEAQPTPRSGIDQPDVAMSADAGSSTLVTLLGTALVGVALLLVAVQAVVRGFGEIPED